MRENQHGGRKLIGHNRSPPSNVQARSGEEIELRISRKGDHKKPVIWGGRGTKNNEVRIQRRCLKGDVHEKI